MSEPLAVEETLWARWGRRAVTLPLYHAQWQRIDAWISAYANPTGAPRVGFENDAHRALAAAS
jgi:hypothetical protein